MSATFKLYVLLIGFFVIVCLLSYGLYQRYGVVTKAQNDMEKIDSMSSTLESTFVAMPIELPQNEVVIPQPREIELPKAQEISFPKVMQKPNIEVIKGAASALIPISSGVIK